MRTRVPAPFLITPPVPVMGAVMSMSARAVPSPMVKVRLTAPSLICPVPELLMRAEGLLAALKTTSPMERLPLLRVMVGVPAAPPMVKVPARVWS